MEREVAGSGQTDWLWLVTTKWNSGNCLSSHGGGKRRFGPAMDKGDALGDHIGSNIIRVG